MRVLRKVRTRPSTSSNGCTYMRTSRWRGRRKVSSAVSALNAQVQRKKQPQYRLRPWPAKLRQLPHVRQKTAREAQGERTADPL